MCSSPLSGRDWYNAHPSSDCRPILSANFCKTSLAVSHGCTSNAFVLPSKKKNRHTIVPNRFIAVISTVDGGFFLVATWICFALSRHHATY